MPKRYPYDLDGNKLPAQTNAEAQAAYRARKRERGLCEEGGCWEPSPNYNKCLACRKARNAYNRSRYQPKKSG